MQNFSQFKQLNFTWQQLTGHLLTDRFARNFLKLLAIWIHGLLILSFPTRPDNLKLMHHQTFPVGTSKLQQGQQTVNGCAAQVSCRLMLYWAGQTVGQEAWVAQLLHTCVPEGWVCSPSDRHSFMPMLSLCALIYPDIWAPIRNTHWTPLKLGPSVLCELCRSKSKAPTSTLWMDRCCDDKLYHHKPIICL